MRQEDNGALNCHQIITSENYVDLYEFGVAGDIQPIANELGAECVQKLTDSDYILHINVPPSECEAYYRQFRYMPIPNIYTLSSSVSLEEAGIGPVLQSSSLDVSGRGVLIGIIDTGIDYTNEAFIYEDNTTKILSIWDQAREGTPPEGFLYGTEYSEEAINLALSSENPESIVPETDEIGHGTYIAGIAAGRENPKKNFTGAAPDASLVVVKLKQAKKCLMDYYQVLPDAIAYQSNDIMQGINYLVDKSKKFNMPLVLLFTGASNEGPHNGNAFLEREFAYAGSFYGYCSVLSAGNEANTSHHYEGVFEQGEEKRDIQFNIMEGERGLFINLWSRLPDELSIELISPSGSTTGKLPIQTGAWQEITFPVEQTEILVYYELVEERTGEEAIYIRILDPTPGLWSLIVYGDIIVTGIFNAWLPTAPLILKNTLFLQSSPDTTVVNPATNVETITVGAYNEVIESIYVPSGRGYTTVDRVKPDFVAPGVNILGPYPSGQYGTYSGTSASAAITAGACALLLQWGVVKGNNPLMNTVVLRTYMIRGARRKDGIPYPNREWGYGELDLLNTFRLLSRF